ncbi:DUF192 domain-containing protein [Thauera sp. CAU 1555]|uniref:DUF192 domain-containing protein n=1 Tax=Thauera sedimentorum TaxID=2767595 RepID=A0ABR9B5R2_9RHOO|nr:DUF192 domain-containing protein [Thauera sedimentorum]MBC9070771.1 DUF192 domain-containing protein [Thauera sedimentorum]MBD8501690.1 DUF192 domain-containing protein [Thauera sedimentorum]
MSQPVKAVSGHSIRGPELAYVAGGQGTPSFALVLAAGFWSRFAGLMLRRPPKGAQGLLLVRCASIHTLFMRYWLDIAWLDGAGRVLACVPDLGPWRARVGPRGTVHVLELKAGSLAAMGIETGCRIEHPALQGRQPG